jgi:ADP-ribose pyrophosphatase YjhB (NUDIX family)
MLLWLPETECLVPPYATHHCGVAGALLVDNKILVVKDIGKPRVGWKLPGGYVNLGEEISSAVTREVFEETK